MGNVWESKMRSLASRGSQSNERDIYLNGKPCHVANTLEEILTRDSSCLCVWFSWRYTALHVLYIFDQKWWWCLKSQIANKSSHHKRILIIGTKASGLSFLTANGENADDTGEGTGGCSCSPHQKISIREEVGRKIRAFLQRGRERGVSLERERPHPQTCPWQVEFHPVNVFNPFIWPFVWDQAHNSQPTRWGRVQVEGVTTQGHPRVGLHLSQPHFHWPLLVLWPPSSEKRKKSLENQPQPRQVRAGGLSLVLQRDGVSLYVLIAPCP